MAFIDQVYKGDISLASLKKIKDDHLCRTLVVTPRDGLWNHPLLADNPGFRLVNERPGEWRIYR